MARPLSTFSSVDVTAVFEGSSLGHCGAHASGQGGYHYHAMPGVQPTNCAPDPDPDPDVRRVQMLCGDGTVEGSVCAEFLSGTGDAAAYAWLSPTNQPKAHAFGSGAADAGAFLLGLRRQPEQRRTWLGAHARRFDEAVSQPIERAVYHLGMLLVRSVQAVTAGKIKRGGAEPPNNVSKEEVLLFRQEGGMRKL